MSYFCSTSLSFLLDFKFFKTNKMFHDEDDEFSNLPVKPRGGGKVNIPADDFDSLPVVRRGAGGPIIPNNDPFDGVKIGGSNGISDVDPFDDVKLPAKSEENGFSLNSDDNDEFDNLPVKPRGKVVVPEEEKSLSSPVNRTKSSENPVMDFDDMPIKAKSPSNIDDLPINAKSPSNFDDMPVNSNPANDFDNMPISSKPVQNLDDLPINPKPAQNLAIDDMPIKSKTENTLQDIDNIPIKMSALNISDSNEISDSFDDLPVKPRGAKPVVVPSDDIPTKLEGIKIIIDYYRDSQLASYLLLIIIAILSLQVICDFYK